MIGYATSTRTRRNIAALRDHGWRLILSPDAKTDHGMRYGVDNGAWGCFQRGEEFAPDRFIDLVDEHGRDADWIVVPDIVMGGTESLRFSAEWLPQLEGIAPLLIAVQDGHEPDDVRDWLGPECGIFIGGSTEWKEQSMPMWGELSREVDSYLHVGRVNSRRRIRLCALAGAHSFDGTSVTRFSKNIHHLDAERRQGVLFTEST